MLECSESTRINKLTTQMHSSASDEVFDNYNKINVFTNPLIQLILFITLLSNKSIANIVQK